MNFPVGKIRDFYLGDSCTGQWTVDTAGWTEWTEAAVQLFTTLSISYCLEVDRRDKKFANKINRL